MNNKDLIEVLQVFPGEEEVHVAIDGVIHRATGVNFIGHVLTIHTKKPSTSKASVSVPSTLTISIDIGDQHQFLAAIRALDAQYVVDELNKMLQADRQAMQSIAYAYCSPRDPDCDTSIGYELNDYNKRAVGLLTAHLINAVLSYEMDRDGSVVKFGWAPTSGTRCAKAKANH